LLGYSHFKQKKYGLAIDYYKRAVELDPNNTEYKALLDQAVAEQKK
jgi:cytochrome c-type biogenesis protein CcmH/NrfG